MTGVKPDVVGGWYEHACPQCGYFGQLERVSGYELRRLVRDRYGETGIRLGRVERRRIREGWLCWYCWKCGHGGVVARTSEGPADRRGPLAGGAPPAWPDEKGPHGSAFFRRPEG